MTARAYGHRLRTPPFRPALGKPPAPTDNRAITAGRAYGHSYGPYGHPSLRTPLGGLYTPCGAGRHLTTVERETP
jgi:hypothetical protein